MSEKIAIVEHEALIALDIAKTLARAGYEIAGPFPSGLEYLEASRTTNFDLVLIDIAVKGSVSGLEAAKRSRSGSGIPCVFITALSDSSILAGTKSAEPLGILVKPFSERELLGTTEIALFRAGMEKKLAYSEKRYRELFDLSLSPRCISDPSGKIIETNETFRKVFGSNNGAMALSSLFVKDGDWVRVKASVLDGGTILGEEFLMTDGAGKRLSILASFSGFRDSGSGAPMLSAEFFDLTESHRLRDELQQAQKMEAMGRLAGGIAHDFNNILTAIIGHAEMLKLDIKPQDPAYEDVEGIAKTADRASHLTKQLLGFSRKQPYSPRQAGIASIVRDTAGILRKLSGESILFSVFLPPSDMKVFVDPVQIEQALINLVVNARDALEGRSDARISVIVDYTSLSEATNVGGSILAPGRYAMVGVADNGSGIKPDVAEKIFEPFFTTKEMGKGTGLGLAIVSSIAAQTHGAISLETEVGKGSAFTLWLPASGEMEGGPAPEIPARSDPAAGKPALALEGNPMVLLVDDDESLLGFLSYVLSKSGASVISARNAGEALLQAEKKDCDILVADINLPGMDGLELYGRLSANRAMKCVFISGRIDSAMRMPERTTLLEKPFTPWELVASIRNALALR